MKAKPTLYDGIRFRSRLEARWAVFMDALSAGAPRFWTYEPDVPGSDYLPDFETRRAYIEIKPSSWSAGAFPNDVPRWTRLVARTQKDLWVFIGEPGTWLNGQLSGTPTVLIFEQPDVPVVFGHWAECTDCGSINVAARGRAVCDDCAPIGPQITHAFHVVRDFSYVDAP